MGFKQPELSAAAPRARNTDPVTSHEAAASVEGTTVTEVQEIILGLIERLGPLTDQGLERVYGGYRSRYNWPRVSPSGLRTRRKELTDAGLIEDSGNKTRLPSGRRAILWRRAK